MKMTEPIATVKQGQLKGISDTDIDGNQFYKFLGIPYAKSPIGPLRFKAPQPAEPWTGIRDATKEGSPCLSMDMFTMTPVGSEDCLVLNVYTRELPRPDLSPKPVMVFIHGGGFTMGSASEMFQGANFLMTQDIVLVTIQYRLGIFGFLSSDDLSLDVPGNAGLKDQTFALKWVKENIASFNGDSNNITIFGVSAGGASVHFQVLSPTAKGLFHKAIAQSGAAFNSWAWGQKNMIQVARKLNENVSSDKEALDLLMNLPEKELLELARKMPDTLLHASKRRPFGPVIEKPNPTAFLTEDPWELLTTGKYNQVPLIHGLTSNEGLISEITKVPPEMVIGGDPKLLETVWFLDSEPGSPKYEKLKALLQDFYFKDGDTREAKHKIFGDLGFMAGIIKSTKLEARTSSCPVYLYLFSYEVPLSKIFYQLLGAKDAEFKGVPHGGDQILLFSSKIAGSQPDIDPKMIEETMIAVKKVTKIWADFARTGKPHEEWEPVTNENELKYFDIDMEPKLKVNPFPDRVEFWEKLYKEVSNIDVRRQVNGTN